MNIQIRKLTEMEDVNLVLELMQNVWQMHEREIVSSFEMKAVTQFGVLLGAYDEDKNSKKPIGFIYAFNKFPDIHYSHMMGIDPVYQNKNIGYLLKKIHRELALQEKNPAISSIEWTVDPLLSMNANLNFRKLGVICNTYHENFYGLPVSVGIYPSLPTDRILVSWLIRSSRVEKRYNKNYTGELPWNSASKLNNSIPTITHFTNSSTLLLPPSKQDLSELGNPELFALEIPDKYTELSREYFDWALDWRIATRSIFTNLFSNNYYLVDFITFKEQNNTRRNFYIFTRNVDEYKY